MIILAHRGFWREPLEKNTLPAFERAFRAGFGVETDIRDRDGEVVISHDPPNGAATLHLSDLLSLFSRYDEPGPLALNVKSDGLASLVRQSLSSVGVRNCFVFDMAVPDALGYLSKKVKFFTRQSEYELHPALYEEAEGVWIDSFKTDWIDAEVVERHLLNGKRVALVSPELHNRSTELAWNAWKALGKKSGVMICTDFPEQAERFWQPA